METIRVQPRPGELVRNPNDPKLAHFPPGPSSVRRTPRIRRMLTRGELLLVEDEPPAAPKRSKRKSATPPTSADPPTSAQ